MAKRERTGQKKNLLIYAHYYYPDVASTAQILKELAEGMRAAFNIAVICAVPSYGGTIDAAYRDKKYYFEKINGVDVIRVRVPAFDKTRKGSRVKNILAYFRRAIWATYKVGEVDCVYTISQPPILGGMLGVWGKLIKRSKLIYNIQDFNPEQITVANYSRNGAILRLMMWIDKFSCRYADKVIVVGRDMIDTLKSRFANRPLPKYAFINNWIDEEAVYPLPVDDVRVAEFRQKYGLEGKFVIMYSGNIGLYYDLENLIKVVERIPELTKTVDGRDVAFAFVGDGSTLDSISDYVVKNHITNVVFIPYQGMDDLVYSLNAGDVHWCSNAKGIKGVSVPSKLYGIMGVGKPVLAVLEEGSEARLIVEDSQCGLVCEPGDYGRVMENIRWFIDRADSKELYDMGARGRNYLESHLTKGDAIDRYIKEIENCTNENERFGYEIEA